jgi:hypothetical protein
MVIGLLMVLTAWVMLAQQREFREREREDSDPDPGA